MKIKKFMKIELKIFLSNLIDIILRKNQDYRRNLVLQMTNNNIFINDGIFTLFLPSENRINYYPRGIAYRISSLAKNYGLGNKIKIEKNDLVINIGANIGELVIWICLRGARVIAIEGDSKTFECLSRNCFGLNSELHNKVLWKTNEKVTFSIDSSNASSTIEETGDCPQNARKESVKAIKLDDLISKTQKYTHQKIKLLIGDCEGSEPELILGAMKILKNIEYISLDCGKERKGKVSSQAEVEKILNRNNFQTIFKQKNKRYILICKNKKFIVKN